MKRAAFDGIKALLVDFGGVYAEEGFREGLMAIGAANGLDPNSFFHTAAEIAYDSGYVVGRATEMDFWERLREATGVAGSISDLRSEILDRFIIRPWMRRAAARLRERPMKVCLLSDQTNWLDELEDRYDFFKEFDHVFNSYHLGASKREISVFTDVADALGLPTSLFLFVDDNVGHVGRALNCGMNAVVYVDEDRLYHDLQEFGVWP